MERERNRHLEQVTILKKLDSERSETFAQKDAILKELRVAQQENESKIDTKEFENDKLSMELRNLQNKVGKLIFWLNGSGH